MEFTEEFCRLEVLAIIKRWHKITSEEFKRSGTTAPVMAEKYRLMIHPDLWEALVRSIKQNYRHGHFGDPLNPIHNQLEGNTIFGLTVIVTRRIEGWQILPVDSILADTATTD